ncbi:MAG: methyltransferase domain-containing protein [Eubacteriales bacterium]
MNDWNSNQYTKFENERTQPSVDLIRRINIIPKSILDIGCGPGNSTNQLSMFFPDSDILAIDSSDNMLDKASQTYPDLKFKKCRVPDELELIDNYDLIFSNACLHWIPDHAKLFPKLMAKLNTGGVLAVQMPLVQDAMFYKILNDLVTTDKWRKLNTINNFHNLSPNQTYDVLSPISGNVTMWETTYFHILSSHSSVIEWYKGSGLRPYLDALAPEEKQEFIDDLLKLIKLNYPVQSNSSVILKMPRLFFIAVK